MPSAINKNMGFVAGEAIFDILRNLTIIEKLIFVVPNEKSALTLAAFLENVTFWVFCSSENLKKRLNILAEIFAPTNITEMRTSHK
jgi:hypothetical protein